MEIENINMEYKQVLQNFINLYKKINNSRVNYFSTNWLQETDLYTIIEYFKKKCLVSHELIEEWKSSPEWSESYDNKDKIIYYLVNKILRLDSKKPIPNEFLDFIKENDISDQSEITLDVYYRTAQNIYLLSNFLYNKQNEPENLIEKIYHMAESSEFKKSFKNLYRQTTSIYLFSGIDVNIINDEQLSKFIDKKNPIYSDGFDMALRSWTLDVRVAIHFSPRIRNIEGKECHLIFMTKRDKICYVSQNGWESEVTIPSAKYKYIMHFYENMEIFANKQIINAKILFVVIDIEEYLDRPMNLLQFKNYMKDIFKKNSIVSKSGFSEIKSMKRSLSVTDNDNNSKKIFKSTNAHGIKFKKTRKKHKITKQKNGNRYHQNYRNYRNYRKKKSNRKKIKSKKKDN